jgi:hypothetical protein
MHGGGSILTSVLGQLIGPLGALLALVLGFIGVMAAIKTAHQMLAVLVMLAAVIVLFIPLPASSGDVAGDANYLQVFSCGSFAHQRKDFSQFPAGVPTSDNPSSASLAGVGVVTAGMAENSCASEHHLIAGSAVVMFFGGTIGLFYANKERRKKGMNESTE